MGIVRMGAPEEEIIFLKQLFHLTRFVETGTFKGGTSVWASQFFKQVDTIEYSEPIYLETSQKFKHIPNINFINQDSRIALTEIVRTAVDPILFWLDAHWCSMGSYGENDQCPLIEELNIIFSSPVSHFILIDDARLFMAPPPLPNLIRVYPNINQITGNLKQARFDYLRRCNFYVTCKRPRGVRYLFAKKGDKSRPGSKYGQKIEQVDCVRKQK